MTHSHPNVAVQELVAALPAAVADAAEVVAACHWVDDGMARELVAEFAGTNGLTGDVLSSLKSLPFVAPRGSGWRIVDVVRPFLLARLESKGDLSVRVDSFVADWLDRELGDVQAATAGDREMEWRSIYHRVPSDPEGAMRQLGLFVDEASRRRLSGDLRAAVALTSARSRWLAGHEAEVAYVVGRRAYDEKDFVLAETSFRRVWDGDLDPHRRLIAGHLLAVIWRNRNAEPWRTQAKSLLEEAAQLAVDAGDTVGESMVLTTLGILLKRIGTAESRTQAEAALRRSLQLREDDWMALNALGALLSERGNRDLLMEAEGLLRSALRLAPESAKASVVGPLSQLLLKLGDEERVREASELTDRALTLSASNTMNDAVRLIEVANVLLKDGNRHAVVRAEQAARRSAEIGQTLGNERHVAIALLTQSFAAERLGDFEGAHRLMLELIAINESLGFDERVKQGRERAAALERRVNRRP